MKFCARGAIRTVVVLFTVAGLAVACDSTGSPNDSTDLEGWSDAAKRNAAHIGSAVAAAQGAIGTEDKLATGATGTFTESQVNRIVGAYEDALRQANLVDDSVLAKISPEFRRRFREQFQRGVRLKIEALQAEERDSAVQKGATGNRLLNEWGSWYESWRSGDGSE